jgi:tetratricopeptide (TPR) repeat protein
MPHESSEQLRKELCDAFDADQPAATIVLARKVLEEIPDHAPTLTRLGHALSELANYAEAETVLNQALENCGESKRYIVLAKLGHLSKFRGNYEAAVEWYRKSIASNPDDAAGYIYLGAVLARQGKLDDAETAHCSATECSSGCIDEAYHNLGLVLRGQGRLEESRECFRKALEIDPDYGAAQKALDDVIAAIAYRSRSDA